MFIIVVFGQVVINRAWVLLFSRARFTSFHTHNSLLTFFVCFFILFHSCCSHARLFGKKNLHEFPISYSQTEWYLPFLLCESNE